MPSNVSYNLAIALVPALVAIGAFGLLYNLIRLSGGTWKAALGFGLAAPALILLIGNLEGALEFVQAQGWGRRCGFWDWVGIKDLQGERCQFRCLPGHLPTGGGMRPGSSIPWPTAKAWTTRSPNSRCFSFLLGDLHSHVVSLPFFILGLSLGLNLFQSDDELGPGWLWRNPVEAGAIALFIGSLAFINVWDFPVMAGALAALLLVKSYAQKSHDLLLTVFRALAVLVPILAVAVVLFLPFYFTLGGQTPGFLPLPLQDVSTRPFLFFLTMGLFAFLAVSFVLRQLPALGWPTQQEAPAAGLALVVALAPLVIWAGIVLVLKLISEGIGGAINEVGGPDLVGITDAGSRRGGILQRRSEVAARK